MVRADATNSTALRLIKVLELLLEQPHSQKALAQALQQAFELPAPPSPDMVLLYIKTLRHLGCDIARPSLRNQYCYSLRKHPFGLFLDEADIDTLVQLRESVETHMGVHDLLNYDELVEVLLQGSWLTADTPYGLSDYFNNARSVDYRPWRPWIDVLLQAAQQQQLLQLGYKSQGSKTSLQSITLLPLELTASSGALYLLGLAQHKPDTMMLRVDKLTAAEVLPCHQVADLKAVLLARKQSPPQVTVYFWLPPRAVLSLPFLPPNALSACRTPPKHVPLWGEQPPNTQLVCQTHRHFALEQFLLKTPYPYYVAQPASLRQHLCQSYQNLLAQYAD
jgi:hypothetical protein